MTRQGNELVFKQSNGTVTRYQYGHQIGGDDYDKNFGICCSFRHFCEWFCDYCANSCAITYTKYTVSSKVRGNWKLKSIKRGQFATGKSRWMIFKQIKITAHTITFKRLTSKIDLPAGDIYNAYKATALSGKYYLYTSDTPYLDGSD